MSCSAIVADGVTGYHLLKIDGYSLTKGTPTGTAIKSNPFTVGGYRWCITTIPMGSTTRSPSGVTWSLSARSVPRRGRLTHLAETFVSVPPSDMNRQLGDLLETEKGADVVFEVAGERFAAHRCVLAARSPVFGAELYGLMKEGDAAVVVCIEDMEARVFKLLLRFMYTDSLPEMKNKDAGVMCQHLLVAADRYNLERLKLICEEKLCKHISMGTVSNMLVLADQHHCAGLKKTCCNFLGSSANLSPISRGCLSVMKELVLGCWCIH
ncbi:Os10g0427400 [Oryza sativa Japonica Group]|uniref:Os10g0427400 protein n=1 Tax=Oryza sativa subsp. japonica TaxID=39947 RepID=C7J7A7_ORYSJ|nr:Os10g0427400 [Oryza sativa Japonica Group]|eukprot:NP_001176164.1 Os10g0427400 [Oryza sativa Japonica Group]